MILESGKTVSYLKSAIRHLLTSRMSPRRMETGRTGGEATKTPMKAARENKRERRQFKGPQRQAEAISARPNLDEGDVDSVQIPTVSSARHLIQERSLDVYIHMYLCRLCTGFYFPAQGFASEPYHLEWNTRPLLQIAPTVSVSTNHYW